MAIPSYTHWNPLIRWLMWRRYETIAELAPPQIELALEFGCGMGLFLATLAARSKRVIAIDLFPELAGAMAKRQDLDVEFGTDLNGIASGSVDLIVAADVLEHLEEPGDTILQFRELLRPRGKLIVSGPTETMFYKIGRLLAGFGDKEHYHLTEIRELRVTIEGCGFTTEARRSLPHAPLPSLFEILSFVSDV